MTNDKKPPCARASEDEFPAFEMIEGKDYSTLSEAERKAFLDALGPQIQQSLSKALNPLMDEYRKEQSRQKP